MERFLPRRLHWYCGHGNWICCGLLSRNLLRLEVRTGTMLLNLPTRNSVSSLRELPQALTGTPTCYIFLCPISGVSDPMDTPFHALVPHGPTREPGLIIISPQGQIRFWDGLGMGLAGGDNFAHFVLDLEEGETMTTLTRSDVRPHFIPFVPGHVP